MPHIYDILITHPITSEWETAIDRLAEVLFFSENTKFLKAVADLKNSDPEELGTKIQEIITNFLMGIESPLELNLSGNKELQEKRQIILSNVSNQEKIEALEPIVKFVQSFVRTQLSGEKKKLDEIHASLLADKFFKEISTSNTKPEDFERALMKNIDEQKLSDRGKAIFLNLILDKLSNDKNVKPSLIEVVLKTGVDKIESKQERHEFTNEASKNPTIKEKMQAYLLNYTKRLNETLVQPFINNQKLMKNRITNLEKHIDTIRKEIKLYSLEETLSAIAKLKERQGGITKIIKSAQAKIKPVLRRSQDKEEDPKYTFRKGNM